MAARYFCDVCNGELTPDQYGRVRRALGSVAVEIMVRQNNVWNSGHICHECVLKVTNKGEPWTTDPQALSAIAD